MHRTLTCRFDKSVAWGRAGRDRHICHDTAARVSTGAAACGTHRQAEQCWYGTGDVLLGPKRRNLLEGSRFPAEPLLRISNDT